MYLTKHEIASISIKALPKVFDQSWNDLKRRIVAFIDSLHDAQYSRKLAEIDPILKSWLPKSDGFTICASGREVKLYSAEQYPLEFEQCWPGTSRRAVWWVAQTLPASEPKFYNASKGKTLDIRTPHHYNDAKGLQLAVIALLDEEVAFRVKFREFLSGPYTSQRSLSRRITEWINSYDRV